MAAAAVEVLAAGPPSDDPYEPAASAWALAEGFRRRGCDVRVLYPAGPSEAAAPDGIVALRVDLPLKHPGAVAEPAEFAAAAGARLRRDAALVVRDPSGLGPLGGRRPVAAVVRSLALLEFDRERSARAPNGVLERLDVWRDRRTLRRLERAALGEAERVFAEGSDLAETLATDFKVERDRLRPTRTPVEAGPPPPARAAARGAIGIPTDVSAVAVLAAASDPERSGVDRACEAFRRIRPLFPGVRLLVAGAPAPTEPGVHQVPGRDRATFARVLAAADVALFVPRSTGFDPGVVLALRQGVAAVALPTVRLPDVPDGAVRRPPNDDPGELSSAIAELVADPAARRALQEAGAPYADRFRPETVAAEIAAAVGVG
ncbi:MAG TPA: glycosyltransferase [Thermoplasmata archaeon]|nr:glycosyltransferase [Thermoplasmata archaeon]